MNSGDLESYIEQGEEKLDKEDYVGAMNCFNEALDIDSANLMANFLKGVTLLELGETDEALSSFNYVLKLDPNFAPVYYNKAIVHLDLLDFDHAQQYIDKFLEMESNNVDGLNLKGLIFFNHGKNQQALNYINDALELEPNHFFALVNKGKILNALDKPDEAIDNLNIAIKIDNDNSEPLWHKGISMLIKEQLPAAIQLFDKALAIDPNNTNIMRTKALTLWDDGKKEEAVKLINKALDIDPEYIILLETKADLLRELKDNKGALEVYSKIRELYPEYPDVWFEIGNTYKDMDKNKESIAAYEKFIEIIHEKKYTDKYIKARRVREYLNWIKETGEMITFSPSKNPQYWQWSTRPEYYLDGSGNENTYLEPGLSLDPGMNWTCHKDTNAGDLILLYRAGKKGGVTYQDIKYLIMARSDAYPLDDIEDAEERKQGWDYGCDYIPLYKFENSLKLKEMQNDPYLEGWNALNRNFLIQDGLKTKEKYWKHLTDVLVKKNPDYGEFLKGFDRNKIIAEIGTEKEVEEKLEKNISILNKFGYNLEVKKRQQRCRGDEGVIDLLCIDKIENNYVVIELKIDKANRNTFGQISGYIGWVMEHKPTEKTVKGIVISRGYDRKFRSALKTNPNIEHIELSEILSKLDIKLV